VQVTGIHTATSVTASYGYTCARLASGSVMCWGENDNGQLGDGTRRHRLKPVRVKGLRGVTAISAAGGHTCAVLSDKTSRCWGYNMYGQLGNGTSAAWDDDIQMVGQPVPVKGISTARFISAGGLHTCALVSHGRVMCWGSNASGQLGQSRLRWSGTPVVIEGP
jgi:alpha-tubulin suppressor-like RCC1 family protein